MNLMRQLLLLTLLLCSFGLYGQSHELVVDSLDIEEVVVSTRRISRETIPVQILNGADLERLNAHSVADAVRYFSGVQIKDYGGVGGLKTVNVRSMGSHHLGVFYDGVEIGNAQNGVVDLGRFSLENMESVAIYNGQKSAIFQAAKDFASSSAIYLTSRRPTFSHDKDYNLNLSLSGGSFETINPSVLWEQKISESLRSSANVEYLYTSGEYPFTYSKADGYDTTAMRENGDVRYLRSEASLYGSLPRGEWQAKAYYYDSERGYPGAVVREEPGVFKNADRQWDRNFFVQSSLRNSFSALYSLKFNAKYAHDYLHYISDPQFYYSDSSYLQQEYYASLANLFSLSRSFSVSLASDMQYNTLDASLDNFAYPERFTSLTSLASWLDLGALKVQGSVLYTFVRDKTAVGEAADDLHKTSPTVVLSYRPTGCDNLALRAFYKRVFRMPTLNDLYYTTVGSSDLDPEYTTQYNIGATHSFDIARHALRSVELQADIYYNQVENKIIAMPTSNQFRWTMVNLGYVEIRGVDLAVNTMWSISEEIELTARANYTFQRAEDLTDPSSDYYGDQIPYIPWHSGSLIVGVEHRSWQFNYSFIYTGERYEMPANIPENYVQPWYTSDLSLSRDFKLRGGRGSQLRLTAEVNNIMNQQYEVVQCYPMPGVNYNIKARITF